MRAARQGIRMVAALAAIGLVVSAAATSAAPAKKPARSAPRRAAATDTAQVLVRIGGETITAADFRRRLEEVPEQARANFATPEGRQQLLDRMVEERVWLATALKNGVADRPKVQQQLAQQRRDLLIRTWLGEVMAANSAPSDSEAKLFYEEHKDDYRTPAAATLHHIQSKTEAEARKVFKLATGGQDWAKLVQKHTADTLTRAAGGSLGSVTKDGQFATLGRQPALAESAFALGAGRIGGPWKTDRGWHVVKVDEVRPAGWRPFETVRPMILRQLGQQRSQEFYRQQLDEARRRLGITPDSVAIKQFVSQKKSAREMFKDAQELGPPRERIAAYEKLLELYPDSEVSAQAQFMVGFICSEELKDYDRAEKAFRAVIDRYPKSELAPSAEWMVEHMRTEEAPPFNLQEADSSKAAQPPQGSSKGSSGKP
ncbi:MAG: peptidyl-prolyl cis-trans isomerase [Candidatus Eisenbacteria bacterium]|nr:peptidyl-prolyl cis-trans isomerase [Candidatus Eisenbacteria bacterium]